MGSLTVATAGLGRGAAMTRAVTAEQFNRAVGSGGDVGVWHETYQISPGAYENVYVNMPPFALGKVGAVFEASEGLQSAEGRMRASA